MLLAFNKPWGVLSQFTDTEGRPTLADFIDQPNVYAAGRLDRDSEGLLLLTDDGKLKAQIADPKAATCKRYLVQVEGLPSMAQLQKLERGVLIQGAKTRPAQVRLLPGKPGFVWPRTPPVRLRKKIPDRWLEVAITEGRNRQVRRMVAAVGLPALRLIRVEIGVWRLAGLKPGQWRVIDQAER